MSLRGFLAVSVGVLLIATATLLKTDARIAPTNIVLSIAAVIGAGLRQWKLRWVTRGDVVIGGAGGLCAAWLVDVEVRAFLNPAERGLGGEGEGIAWTPLGAAFCGTVPLIVFLLSAVLMSFASNARAKRSANRGRP